MATTNLSTLKINYLTQSQYDTALANDEIEENEIYMTPAETITGVPNINLSFTAPDGITWSSLANTWTPSVSGIATTRINPSNSSSAYLLLRDSSNGNATVAQVASTGGLGMSVSWPVIGGHTYNVGGNSTNITSMETRFYPFNIEVTV